MYLVKEATLLVVLPYFLFLCIFTLQYSYDPKTADWSREMRGMPLYSTVNLNNWLLIYSSRDSNNAKDFEQTLKKVGGPMGITVAPGIE